MKKLLLFIVLAFLVISCDMPTKIKEVHQNHYQYENKEVMVKGKVIEAVDFLGIKYFKIYDGTGEIYILPKNIVPSKGDEVTVKGRYNRAFEIGDVTLELITE